MEHGTRSTYAHHRCRCADCSEASRAYNRAYAGVINPEHLYIGDLQQNVADRVARGRTGRTLGSKNGSSKLTEDVVLLVKRAMVDGDRNIDREPCSTACGARPDISRRFGIEPSLVSHIRRGFVWSHVRA